MDSEKSVAIIGAGTMGKSIASLCCLHFTTILADNNKEILDNARTEIHKYIDHQYHKERITESQKNTAKYNIKITDSLAKIKADIIIEAIKEDYESKIALYKIVATHNPDSIILTNTSSLSITKLGKFILHPQRFAGLHFFNPATVMKLVELVIQDKTNEYTIKQVQEFCSIIKKTTIICKDSSGFVVNRVARAYYTESLQSAALGEQIQNIDESLQNIGFPMGAFRLMDLIGQDINFAVTTSLFEQMFFEPRFRPSIIQQKLVDSGKLGRKTKSGFYNYD